MEDQRKYLTRRQVREMFGFSLNFIDKRLPRTKVGGKILINVEALKALLAGGQGIPVPEHLRTIPHYRTLAWQALRSWTVNECRPLCDHKADLLAGTVTGFLLEQPDGDIRDDAFVLYALINQPPGGGETGAELRRDIQMEAALRSEQSSI